MDACLFIHAFSFIYEYSSNIFPTKKTKKKKIFIPQMDFFEMVERKVLEERMVPFMDTRIILRTPYPKTPPFALREKEVSGHRTTEPASDRS